MDLMRRRPWMTWPAAQTALVVIGVLLRLRHFFENRSFWQDELCLAISIVNRSFDQIWRHVLVFPDFAQAPLIFQLIEKVFVNLLGNSEWSLRLFPFMVSLATLMMARRFFSRLLSPLSATFALALFALSEPLVYFAAELKPYGVDVLAALIMLELFMALRERWSLPRLCLLACVGALMIWFSYAMLFILAGGGALILWEHVVRREKGRAAILLAVFCLWGGSFLVLYRISLSLMLNPDLVHNWRLAGGFAPEGADLGARLIWLGKSLLAVVRSPLGLAPAWLWAVIFIVGKYTCWRTNRRLVWWLLLPFMLALGAAWLDKYPFYERLLLFLVPSLLAVIAIGMEYLLTLARRYGSVWSWTVAALLLAPSVVSATYHAVVPRGQEHNREVMAYISDHYRPGDVIIVSNQAQYPFWYYGQRDGLMARLPLQPMPGDSDHQAALMLQLFPEPVRRGDKDYVAMRRTLDIYDRQGFYQKTVFLPKASAPVFISSDRSAAFTGAGRIWVFLSHHNTTGYPAFVDGIFSAHGTRIDAFERPGAVVYLYTMDRPPEMKEAP